MKLFGIAMQDINEHATCAMHATLGALYKEGLLTSQQVEEFADTHIILAVNNNSMWAHIKKYLGINPTQPCFLSFKVSGVLETKE